MKTSRERQLGYKPFGFHSAPYLLQGFHTWAIYQLSSLSGRISISEAFEMIQYKWFIIDSHVFSDFFFLGIYFSQTHYTLKFNLQDAFFPVYFLCLDTTSTFQKRLLVSIRFLNSAIKTSSPLNNNKKWVATITKNEYVVFDTWHIFYPAFHVTS